MEHGVEKYGCASSARCCPSKLDHCVRCYCSIVCETSWRIWYFYNDTTISVKRLGRITIEVSSNDCCDNTLSLSQVIRSSIESAQRNCANSVIPNSWCRTIALRCVNKVWSIQSFEINCVCCDWWSVYCGTWPSNSNLVSDDCSYWSRWSKRRSCTQQSYRCWWHTISIWVPGFNIEAVVNACTEWYYSEGSWCVTRHNHYITSTWCWHTNSIVEYCCPSIEYWRNPWKS